MLKGKLGIVTDPNTKTPCIVELDAPNSDWVWCIGRIEGLQNLSSKAQLENAQQLVDAWNATLTKGLKNEKT